MVNIIKLNQSSGFIYGCQGCGKEDATMVLEFPGGYTPFGLKICNQCLENLISEASKALGDLGYR